MDEQRQRRRARLAQRRDVPGPGARRPGPGQPLRERLGTADREALFAERLETVRRDVVRRNARARRIRAAEFVALAVLALLVGLVAASVASGLVGLVVGLATFGLIEVGRRLAHRAAVRRGASAWDWKSGRFVLMGRPADEVQKADRPPPVDPRF